MKRLTLLYAILPVAFLLIYYRTFTADYAYLDEAHQLWNNADGSNYFMFLVQGRSLTGRLIEWLFGSIDSISQLKYIRLFSLGGWILTSVVWLWLSRKWIKALQISRHILLPCAIFVVCSPATAISIGWASCAEIFLATLFALFSGSVIFRGLPEPGKSTEIRTSSMLVGIIFGVCSLLLYQNAFGIFLLPFIILAFNNRSASTENLTDSNDRVLRSPVPDHRVRNGIIFYMIIYVVYFLVFRYQLNHEVIIKAERATISTDPVSKILFFFSGPLPKAFTLNILYHTRSLLIQITAPVVMLLFALSVYLRWKSDGIMRNAVHLLKVLGLLALIYLPSLAVRENFSSYRTMLPLSLAVFILLMIQLFHFVPKTNIRGYVAAGISVLLICIGFYNYNYQFSAPLQKEYVALRHEFKQKFKPGLKTIYFIRPGKTLFRQLYGTESIKDEFGNPSTLRDWVPEPLTRLMTAELSGDRKTASAISVIQFDDEAAFRKSGVVPGHNSLVIDMNLVLRSAAGAVNQP